MLPAATPRVVWSDADLQVLLVSDGSYRMDAGAMFGVVPKVLWSREVHADDDNGVSMALNCLLVRDGDVTILVDTGFGTRLTGKELGIYRLDGNRQGLAASLQAAGSQPGDIDVVLNTHLHWDHCGGNTHLDEAGAAVPTFPRARYAMQRIELSEALWPNERTAVTYGAANYKPLLEADRVDVLEGDTRISPRVRTIVTPGHTRSHQCVVVEPDGGPPIVFLGDVAPLRVHLERVAWVPALDVLPLDSMETKRGLCRWLAERDALCVLQHEQATPVGRLRHGERHFTFLPEAESTAGAVPGRP